MSDKKDIENVQSRGSPGPRLRTTELTIVIRRQTTGECVCVCFSSNGVLINGQKMCTFLGGLPLSLRPRTESVHDVKPNDEDTKI